MASGVSQYELTSQSSCTTGASCVGTASERKATTSYGPQVAGTANNLLPVSVTVAAGDNSISATTTATYDNVGNLTAVDGPLAGTVDTTVTRYDAARQVIGQVSADPDGTGSRVPIATRLTYNLDGQVTQSEVGTVTDQSDTAWANFSSVQQVVTTYDSSARPIKSEVKAGATTYAVSVQSYDAAGRPDCSTVRMDPSQWASQSDACTPQTTGPNGSDRIVRPTYDAGNRVTSVVSGYGTVYASTESKTYTNNGLISTVKDGENNLTTYEYDGHDRLVKTRYPVTTKGAGTSSTTDFDAVAYDANGNVTTRTQRDGTTITFAYDNLNRLTSRTPQGENAVNYSYNLLGQVTQVQRPGDSTTLTYAYDGLGRATGETQPFGSVAYQLDISGRMTRMTWADGFYVTYDYDNLGKVTAIRENGATSGVGVLATYGYDSLGRRSTVTRGNGTTSTWSYDAIGRLSCLTSDISGGGTLNCTPTATGSDRASIFGYNPSGQITSATQANDAYAWTGSVNADRPYIANGLNQYTLAGSTSFAYDARGNLTTSGTSTYSYNKLNQLTGGPSVTLSYDPVGRLSQVSATATTRFAYAGGNMVQESNTTGTILRRYVLGPGTDEPIVWYEGSGTTDRRFLIADERGSVVAVTDSAGAALSLNRYDEYGIPQAINTGRYQYTGQAWLPELGMYYYKARIYSPTMGRFMQTDPIGYGDGMNWYNYVGSDPINGSDPSGLTNTELCTGTLICKVHWDGTGGYGAIGAGAFGVNSNLVGAGSGGSGNDSGAAGLSNAITGGTIPCPGCTPPGTGEWRWISDGTASGTTWIYLGGVDQFNDFGQGSGGLAGSEPGEILVRARKPRTADQATPRQGERVETFCGGYTPGNWGAPGTCVTYTQKELCAATAEQDSALSDVAWWAGGASTAQTLIRKSIPGFSLFTAWLWLLRAEVKLEHKLSCKK